MTTLEMAIIVTSVLWGIVGVLVGVIWNDVKSKIKALEKQTGDLEKRVQTVENIQGTAINNLEKKFDKLEIQFEKLESKFDMLTEKVSDLSTYITSSTKTELRILEALEEFNKK